MQLSEQLEAYLTQQGIPTRDYRTGQPEGEDDQILYWGESMGPQPTTEQLTQAEQHQGVLNRLAQCVLAAQTYLDSFAKTKGYDNIRSAISYLNDPYPQFAADALVALHWRSAVWQKAIEIETAVKNGTQECPKSVEEFLALLPNLSWTT